MIKIFEMKRVILRSILLIVASTEFYAEYYKKNSKNWFLGELSNIISLITSHKIYYDIYYHSIKKAVKIWEENK